MTKFTADQVDHICYQIGEWYFKWKHDMTPNGEPHRLGFAKEELKTMICGEGPYEKTALDSR